MKKMPNFNPIIIGKYIRWQKDGVNYVGLYLSFNGLVQRKSIGDNPSARKNVELEASLTMAGSRYFYMDESILKNNISTPKGPFLIWSDDYSLSITDPKDKDCLFKEFKVNLELKVSSFNKTSSNPYGRYDNSPNDSKRYFIFNTESGFNLAQNALANLPTNTILTPYKLYEYDDVIPSNLEICGMNMHFNTEIVSSDVPGRDPLPNTNKITEIHYQLFENENSDEGDFTQKRRIRKVTSTVTPWSIKITSATKQGRDQISVMNGNSANNVATALGIKTAGIDYEWLHLSAFSFGTPNNLKSAQHIDNLILGTAAANSQMLLFETQIQTLVMSYGLRGNLTVLADCCKIDAFRGNQYATWLATSITYSFTMSKDTAVIPKNTKDSTKRKFDSIQNDFNTSFVINFDPFQMVDPTKAEQLIIKAFLANLITTYQTQKAQKNQKTDEDFFVPNLINLRRIPVSEHNIEKITLNFLGQTNVPAIREYRNGKVQTTVLATDLTKSISGTFSFAELYGGMLDSTRWLVFDNAQFAVTEEDGQTFLEFQGNLQMDESNPMLAAFKSLLGNSANIQMSGLLLLDGEITSIDDLENLPDPKYISLSAVATFDHSLTTSNSVQLTNLALELDILRVLDYLNFETEWEPRLSISGALKFFNLNSDQPVILEATLSYSEDQIMVNGSVSDIANIFGLEWLTLDFINAEFEYGVNNEIGLTANFTPFITTFQLGGKMSDEGVGLFGRMDDLSFEEIDEIYTSLTGDSLDLPEWDISFENVMLSLATADMNVGDQALQRGLGVQATVTVSDYTATVNGQFSPEGIHFEGDIEATRDNVGGITGLKLQSIRLLIDLNRTDSNFMFSGELLYNDLVLDCSIHLEKNGDGWNETIYAEIQGASFGLSTLFPSAENTILDTLKFSDVAVIYSSYTGTFQKGNATYDVTQGLQLKAVLTEIPAISQLIHNRNVGMALSAQLSETSTSFSITMPESTALQLGSYVECDPFQITAILTPTPQLMLVFGISLVNIPNQGPLEFDLSLDLGVAEAEAAATMQGTISNFMGIQGLDIGPALALQIGIIYAEFAATGIPSELGLAAGASFGDTSLQFAMSVSENPEEEIMYAELENISSDDLLAMINTFTGVTIPVAPDFLDIHDLKFYCAPMGGQIGVLKFQPGVNLNASLLLAGVEIDIMAYFNTKTTVKDGVTYAPGLLASGKVMNLVFGPLEVTGLEGTAAELDLELTESNQKIHLDCAVKLYNDLCGAYVDISNAGINFELTLDLSDLLYIDISGNSTTTDQENMDFLLTAELNNELNDYLSGLVIEKFNAWFAAAEMYLPTLEQQKNEALEALTKEIKKAKDDLDQAEKAAEQYLQDCQQGLSDAQAHMDAAIDQAQTDLANAKNAYNKKLNDAKKSVSDAQAAFDKAVRDANSNLDSVQKTWDKKIKSAKKDLDKAQKSWDATLNNAMNQVAYEQNETKKLKKEADNYSKDMDKYSIFNPDYYYYAGLYASAEADYEFECGLLDLAMDALEAIESTSDYLVFQQAQSTLDSVQKDADKAIKDAQDALNAVATGVEQVALQTAIDALDNIQSITEYTVWQNAQNALDSIRKSEQKLVASAQHTLDTIGKSAVYQAFALAQTTLDAVQNGPLADAYHLAESLIAAAKSGLEDLNSIADSLVESGAEAFYLKSANLSASLSDIKAGKLFTIDFDLVLLGTEYIYSDFTIDVHNLKDFAQKLYEKALSQLNSVFA